MGRRKKKMKSLAARSEATAALGEGRGRGGLWLAALLALVGFLLYGQTLHAPFILTMPTKFKTIRIFGSIISPRPFPN
ncbi:MAG: hypothetical protein IPP35_12610 [Elusimicrobia bacterium]|nr:hypothetical protein [Elusimicrobiota bacterium]